MVGAADALAGPAGHLAALSLGVAVRRNLLHRGLVLAVPDSTVIDTGGLKVVYRQAAPDVFEGMAVELGPRMAVKGDPTNGRVGPELPNYLTTQPSRNC